MPAHDRQRPIEEGTSVVVGGATDNPLREASSTTAPPWTGRAMREAGGTNFILGAIFVGADALVVVELKTSHCTV